MPRTEEYNSESRQINGVAVSITTYCVGEAWHCTIANIEPGANIARGDGKTREEAVNATIAKAEARIK